jgi:hypothetical protein
VIDFVMARDNLAFVEAVLKLADEPEPTQPSKPRRLLSTTRYEIRDEAGTLQAIHLRKDFDDGKKAMPWLHPDGRPSSKDDPIEPVDLSLYGAHELGDAKELLLVEGEKARDVAKALGVAAVGTVTGASHIPGDAALRPLIGKRVVWWADNDPEGQKHKNRTAARLIALGQPAELIRDLAWPEAPHKGDIADYAAADGTADGVRAMMATSAQWFAPTEASATEPKSNTSRLVIRTMSGVEPRETDWLLKRWLARGKVHLFGGLAGDGKSTIAAAIAAIGSVGGKWPDGTSAPRFRTLFLLGEDALDDTLRPRLDVHGADVDQVLAIETVLDDDGRERYFNVQKHLPLLETAIGDHRVDLVVIDPLTTIMPGSDRNAEGDTRDALTPLVKLAERTNVAVLGIVHVGKGGTGQRSAAQRILGATAFVAIARVVWMTASAPNGHMVLSVVKSNLAMKPDSLLWSRDEDAAVSWHGVSEQSVEDLLREAVAKAPRADSEGFLRELLAEGSMASSDVERKAQAAGISWRTLRRAADDIGVMKWREGGVDGHWRWRLPDGQPRYAEPVADTSRSNLSTFPSVDKFPESNLSTPRDTEVDKLDNFAAHNLSNMAESGQVHAATPISANGANHFTPSVMEGGQLGHMEVLGVGQVPNGTANILPADCLTPKLCGGKLGRCDRAPRCRTDSPAAATCIDCQTPLPAGWGSFYCARHCGAPRPVAGIGAMP